LYALQFFQKFELPQWGFMVILCQHVAITKSRKSNNTNHQHNWIK
jgi:hypothetical protein